MSAGAVSVPTIVPLRVPHGEAKNDIDSNTLIELKSGTTGTKIYYTVDNTRPETFRQLGENTTVLYTEPFMLSSGRRTVKALAKIRDGRESNIVTKVFNVKYAVPTVPSDSSDDLQDDEENFRLEMARQNKRISKRITTSVLNGSPSKLQEAWNTSSHFQQPDCIQSRHSYDTKKRRSSFSHSKHPDCVRCVYCDTPQPKNEFSRFCGNCGKPVPVNNNSPMVEPGSMGMCMKCRSYVPLSQPNCIVCEEPIGPKLKPVASVYFENKILCGSCGKHNPPTLTHCTFCEHRFPAPVHAGKDTTPLPKLDAQLVSCPMCMRINNPDARFCDWCGSKPVPEQSPLTCSLCKSSNPPYARFCSQCGANFSPPSRMDPRNSQLGEEFCDSYSFQELPMWQSVPLPSFPKSPPSTRLLPPPTPPVRDSQTQTVGLFYPGGKKIAQDQMSIADMRSREFKMRDKNHPLTAISPGKGYWRKQLDHVCGHIRGYTTNEVEFRSVFAEPRLGKITGAAISEAEDEISMSFTFTLKGHTEFGEDGLKSLQRDIYQNQKIAFGRVYNPGKENVKVSKKNQKMKKKQSSIHLDKMNPEDRLLIKEVGEKGNGQVSEVKQLLMEGADVNCVDGNGISVLCHSIIQGRLDCTQALLNAGSDINKQSGTSLNTPLHEAVKLGPNGKNIVEHLLESDAKINVKNAKGLTAYDMAVKSDYNSIVMLFNAHKGKMMVNQMVKSGGYKAKSVSKYSESSSDDTN